MPVSERPIAPVSFSDGDLKRFAAASGDHNPLHTSASYARATSFGRPVVFGVLAGLALVASAAGDRPGEPVRRIRLGFPRPMFAGREYEVQTDERTGVSSLLEHGERVAWAVADGSDDAAVPEPPTQLHGVYACDVAAVRDIVGRGLDVLTDQQVAACALASFLAGMHVPGRQALLLEVEVHRLADAPTTAPLRWRAGVTRHDERRGVVTVAAVLTAGDADLATISYRAAVRREAFVPDLDELAATLPATAETWCGREALVVGGSRGLGAVLAAQLALAGARVTITYAASRDAAQRLVDGLRERGCELSAVQADARDAGFWAGYASAPELIVCSAWPPLERTALSEHAVAAGVDHVVAGLQTAAIPLLALAPRMRGEGPVVLMVSSRLLTVPDPGYWPYVAAKAAMEQVARAVALRHKNLRVILARPPALATDYVTAIGAAPLSPVRAAATMLAACADGGAGVELVDERFDLQ